MPAESVQANIPEKITKGGLLAALSTAEELTCDPPRVIVGVDNVPQEAFPARHRKRNIVAAFIQNTGTVDVFYTFDSTPPDADNHHGVLAPYQQLDVSKNRQQLMVNGVGGAWRVATTQFTRSANM